MARRRDSPYIWVKWITGLMAGEAHCEWAAWFRTHYTYEKRPSDFNFAEWNAQHAAMVRDRCEALKAQGYSVFVGDQNAFKLPGKTGITLSGKPDILAVRGDEALVVDCKTGTQRDSDYYQVLTYMLALPLVNSNCRGRRLSGELQYRDRSVAIDQARLTEEVEQLLRRTIHRAGGDSPTPKAPSFEECRYCDISAADCPERVETEVISEGVEHELF